MVSVYRIVLVSSVLCFGVVSCRGTQDIFEAIKNKDWNWLNNVSSLDQAEQYALVNQRDQFGNTPLFAAAGAGNLQIIRFLIGCGADVEALSYGGMTPLINAASIGSTDVVIFLLQAGAVVATADHNGLTALHHAARGGYLDTVWVFVEHYADVRTIDRECNTGLHDAALRGHYDVAELLIEHGADVKAPNGEGVTPLHYAAQAGRVDLIRYLLAKHADPYAKDKLQLLPLYYALESGNAEAVELLMAQTQLTVEEMCNQEFLHRAARRCPETILRKLVGQGMSSSQGDREGCTPLHYAAYGCNLPAARYLVNECHADVDSRNRGGYTPVHASVVVPAEEILVFLLNSGGLIDAANAKGQTPLMAAALTENEHVVNVLLEHGCPIDEKALKELKELFEEWFSEDFDEKELGKISVIKRWNELEEGLSEVMLPDVLKVLIMKHAAVCPFKLKQRLLNILA